MATASQDRYVRVWSFEDLHVDLSRLDVYAPKPQLRLGGRGAGRQKTVAVVCEALLAGHEDWVHGVRWMVAGDGDQQLTLLSSSMDRTMILWQQVSDDGGSVGTYLGVCMYGVEEGLIPGARYGGNEYIDDQCEQGAAGGPPPLLRRAGSIHKASFEASRGSSVSRGVKSDATATNERPSGVGELGCPPAACAQSHVHLT